jgi:hypothetical protein
VISCRCLGDGESTFASTSTGSKWFTENKKFLRGNLEGNFLYTLYESPKYLWTLFLIGWKLLVLHIKCVQAN